MRPFVHLHNHTSYSVRDGLAKLSPMIAVAAADHQPAIATTDHGSLGATWKMAGLCAKAGLKYIPGVELYLAFGDRREREALGAPTAERVDALGAGGAGSDAESKGSGTKKYQHLTVLATSQVGWRNLLLVENAAHDPEAFWSKPRADMDLLAEHAGGLVVLSGCVGGPVAGRLLRGEPDLAAANLARLVEIFGRERVFVEVMDHGIAAERAILPELCGLARRFGLEVVATNDCHYTRPEEHTAHDALLCLADDGKTLSSPDRWRFDGTGYHLRSASEMRAIFDDQPGTEHACDATLRIAEMVAERVVPEARMHLPRFPLPDGVTAERRLFELVKEGARARYGDPYPEAVRERLRHEYELITRAGLADYFLILADVIAWAKGRAIRVGPGRGSAGGSVVSYCLGIITIDPIRYGLLFERFLSPDRVGMPDIDTDFEQGRREEVFDYLTSKYGIDCTAHIGTVTFQLTNAALRNAGRVLDEAALGARLAAKVPNGAGGKPVPFAVLEDPSQPAGAELRAALTAEPKAASVLEIARAFEGNITAEGIHACGFLISDEPLPGLVPLRRDRRKGRDGRGLVTEWDGTDCDAAGMLKLDVLGIRNLDVIAATERIIYERTGEQVDAEAASDDVDDPDPIARARARVAWQLVAEGRTAGVFQLESAGMTELAQRVAPTSVEELSAIVALFRPGPLGAKTHDRYAERKAGREAVDYTIFTDDPAEAAVIEAVLGDTLGLTIYQESMMQLSQRVAGFDAHGRDRLRKAIGKKLRAEMDAVGEAFIAGAVADHDVDGRPKLAFKRSTAEALWRAMEGAGDYAFNKCLTGDTVLVTGEGASITIDELYQKLHRLPGLTLLAYDVADDSIVPKAVKDVHLKGRQAVWRLTLSNGRHVTATARHRFLCPGWWRAVGELSVGDELVVDVLEAGAHRAGRSRIVSIEPAGIAQTFDVEMDDEGHNFLANGIVSHNSHSVGYAKLAYETAWLKANWPAAYGAGLLSVTGAEDRRIPILRSLTAEGITVSTPDVNLGGVHTTLGADDVVRLGLVEIKGMRSDDAQAIVAEREENGPYASMADLLARVRVTRSSAATGEVDAAAAAGGSDSGDGGSGDGCNAVSDNAGGGASDNAGGGASDSGGGAAISLASARALVEAGACDAFGPRAGLLRAMRVLRGGDHPIPATEWGVVERASRERERLGAAISCNPLQGLSEQLRTWRSPRTGASPIPLHRIEERCPNGAAVSTIGVVAGVEVSKKGRRRAQLVLEGSSGSIECVVWTDQLQLLEREHRVPPVGSVVGVDARVRKTTVVLAPEVDDGAGDTDPLGEDAPVDTRPPATMTRTELVVADLWTCELDDGGRKVLPILRVPRARARSLEEARD